MESDKNQPVCIRKENIHYGRGFHLSSLMFSIFRVLLNHQAQGTSTWLIIGSNSHTAQPNIFCWGDVTPLWLSMPLFHTSMVHLNCSLLVSPNPIYLYTISCLCFFPQFVVLVLLKIRKCKLFPCRSAEVGSINTQIWWRGGVSGS